MIQAPLPNGLGSNTGYDQAAVFAGPSSTGWVVQEDLYDDVGNNGNANSGQPGFNGSTLVYGAPTATTAFPNGVATVQVRSNTGTWSLQQQLIPGDGAPQGSYGLSSAAFGNLAVVGSVVGSGPALYAWQRTGTTWTQIQQFQPSDIGSGDSLWVAAMTQNQLFLSAIDQNSNQGAVYVYSFIAGQWVQVQKLVGAPGDTFGNSVSCDGNTLVIGAVGNGAGKAYVYTTSGGGVWSLLTTLTPSDGVSGDSFGVGVSVDGTLMAIGARNKTENGHMYAGAAYIFQFANSVWTQTEILTATVPAYLIYFGWATAVFAGSPSWIAIGAPAYGNTGAEGAVYFFSGPNIAPLEDPIVTLTFKGQKVYA
jgi:hypothetical protein